jgi:hypothetical protein
MQGLLPRRTTGPHCHLPAVLQQSSANPQPILSQSSAHLQPILKRSRGLHRTLLDIDNREPDDADACRGYVAYRTSTLKTIPGSRCGAAAITEVHGHGRRT